MGDIEAYFLTFQSKLLAIYIYNVYICSILTLIHTTMAIVKNFWLKGSKKRLGGAVLYKAMGQTRARELSNSVTNPRTEAQMSQRIKWSNLVNFYRANSSWMKYAFENKKANQSEYNVFMSLNVTNSRIALTKQMAASGACVVYPYIMTQGSLPSIEWQDSPSESISNIYVNPGDTIDDYNAVGEFSEALLEQNAGLREGDQLSFIRITQMTNALTGYPYIIVRKYELLLNKRDGSSLKDYWPVELFTTKDVGDHTLLAINKESRQGGFVMILSRTTSGRTYVSSQTLITANMESIISNYSSTEAVQSAIASYGESEDAFLSSTSANAISATPIALTINYAQVNGDNYSALMTTPVMKDVQATRAAIYFNADLPTDAVIGVSIKPLQGTAVSGTEVTRNGNTVSTFIPQVQQADEDKHLGEISVTVQGITYTIRFADSNAYTIEGLE